MTGLDHLGNAFVGFATTLPRLGVAFMVLPLLSAEIVPPLVRNVFVVSLALGVSPLVAQSAGPLPATGIVPLVMKEAFIGLIIAYTFSIVFWAIEGAGEIIDAKIGSTTAQIADPVLGHQTTLTATFFSRLAAYLFVGLGGLTVFVGILLQSYAIWPIGEFAPRLQWRDDLVFVTSFSSLFEIMLLLAAPALIVLSLIEFALGLVNRFAERLNVFSLSLALKAWAAVLVIGLLLPSIASLVLDWLGDQGDLLERLVQALAAAA